MEKSEIQKKIINILIERLNLPMTPEEFIPEMQIFGPADSDDIESLELDSVDGLEIVVGLGNEFQVTMTEEEGPEAMRTIGSLTDFVHNFMAEAV